MFSRISRSWQLVKASWEVLKADRELLIFPLISFIGVVIVMITFAIPAIAAGVFDSVTEEQSNFPVAGYIIGFLFYVVMYTVIIFFNSALVGAAMIRLRGGDPTVNDGLRIAMDHIGVIVQYAIISATVGLVLRFLRERGGIIGAIMSWLGALAWNVATFLVVPVLVMEDVSPVDAIKRSAGLLKQTWGEQIVGKFSIGLISGLVTIAAVIVVGAPLLLIAVASGSVVVIIFAVAVVVLIVAGIALVSSALNGIYVAAVYRYAVEGDAGAYFSQELISGAFEEKPKKRGFGIF